MAGFCICHGPLLIMENRRRRISSDVLDVPDPYSPIGWRRHKHQSSTITSITAAAAATTTTAVGKGDHGFVQPMLCTS